MRNLLWTKLTKIKSFKGNNIIRDSLKKYLVGLVVAILIVSIVSISSVSEQLVDAGSRKKIHFTQTITSGQDPGQDQGNHQMIFALSPNDGTLYDGSMTFVASVPVQVVVLHEINPVDSKGQATWTVDGDSIYGLSIFENLNKSGSHEFTGAAVGLRSTDGTEFTATVSVDGWIRGQPTEIIMQKIELAKEEPKSLLSRTHVPAEIPFHKALYDGNEVLYIITDSSDKEYATTLTENQDWIVSHAQGISNLNTNQDQKLFIFKNGIEGDGIYGFQNEVISFTPNDEEYTALNHVIEVSWKLGQKPVILESTKEVIEAEESGRITFNDLEVIVNSPQIKWPDGQMKIRSDKTISDDMLFDGGQITEINYDENLVTFVAHRGWSSSGQTIYYIVTDTTPSGPAETMGIVFSPASETLFTESTPDLFMFKNGIKGSGPLGYQPIITTTNVENEKYSSIWKVHSVNWNDENSAKILETKLDLDTFEKEELITVSLARPTNSIHIINSPIINPFQ